jgi:hypothetical protein
MGGAGALGAAGCGALRPGAHGRHLPLHHLQPRGCTCPARSPRGTCRPAPRARACRRIHAVVLRRGRCGYQRRARPGCARLRRRSKRVSGAVIAGHGLGAAQQCALQACVPAHAHTCGLRTQLWQSAIHGGCAGIRLFAGQCKECGVHVQQVCINGKKDVQNCVLGSRLDQARAGSASSDVPAAGVSLDVLHAPELHARLATHTCCETTTQWTCRCCRPCVRCSGQGAGRCAEWCMRLFLVGSFASVVIQPTVLECQVMQQIKWGSGRRATMSSWSCTCEPNCMFIARDVVLTCRSFV